MHTLAQLQSGKLAGIQRLNLSADLTSLPVEIFNLADSLEILDLSNNRLRSLPKELSQFKKLKIIFASNNQFVELPEVLGQCESLEMVGFKANQIARISERALPPTLRWLTLTDNKLEALPDTIGQCRQLQKLLLAGNRLQQLPIGLSRCEKLELLRISANQITHCPEHVLELPNLAWFAFAGNPFSECKAPQATVPEISSSHLTLHEVLGQGASGVISKATWNSPQHQFPNEVAVKIFKGEVTSDGYPQDELRACLKVGSHPNLVKSLAQVNEPDCRALIMKLIPPAYKNLGLPPSFASCTRDIFPENFSLTTRQINKMIEQMTSVFEHLHAQQVCHGDLYAHNTLFDQDANILFGDFGAASMYHMLTVAQQEKIKAIEHRALGHFIEDLSGICAN
ncbi:leucine-rich repeat-containing protein kinase family protein [Zhongshania sp.]|uniref:leucine-rich repeat-containing protein kinase family protein n=2 Tax=Zhongshania sp. TaxID=1971902 RepID=UPI003564447A